MKIIIIGHCMVGYMFCEKLITKAKGQFDIVFCEEIRPAYDHVHLNELYSYHDITESFDHLVLATGSALSIPSVPCVEKEGALIYHAISSSVSPSAKNVANVQNNDNWAYVTVNQKPDLLLKYVL